MKCKQPLTVPTRSVRRASANLRQGFRKVGQTELARWGGLAFGPAYFFRSQFVLPCEHGPPNVFSLLETSFSRRLFHHPSRALGDVARNWLAGNDAILANGERPLSTSR